jgi:hypothetical protein
MSRPSSALGVGLATARLPSYQTISTTIRLDTPSTALLRSCSAPTYSITNAILAYNRMNVLNRSVLVGPPPAPTALSRLGHVLQSLTDCGYRKRPEERIREQTSSRRAPSIETVSEQISVGCRAGLVLAMDLLGAVPDDRAADRRAGFPPARRLQSWRLELRARCCAAGANLRAARSDGMARKMLGIAPKGGLP